MISMYPTIKDPAGAGSLSPSDEPSVFWVVVALVLILRLHLRHHFADEIILLLLDARADFVAHELRDLGAGLLEQLFDRRCPDP